VAAVSSMMRRPSQTDTSISGAAAPGR
jgi:hypothetical protein